VIISGVILAVLGYMSGLTILQAIGGILIVVMWGNSNVFFPAAMPGLELAGSDIDARRVAATAVAAGRPVAAAPAVEGHQAAARPAEAAGTTVDSAELSQAAANLCSPG
jgi:hypothetical protein